MNTHPYTLKVACTLADGVGKDMAAGLSLLGATYSLSSAFSYDRPGPLNPQLQALNPKAYTLHPTPYTLDLRSSEPPTPSPPPSPTTAQIP